jgi:hypothetical protein
MQAEPRSLEEMGETGVLKYWPNLLPSIYHKTSEIDVNYNCVAWVNKIQTINIDFSQDDEGNPKLDPYYLTSYPYIEYFESLGFETCPDSSLEEGFEKIAIYEKDGKFKHVARQLSNGNWTSKIGEFEDIEHYNLEAVEGHPYKSMSYGRPTHFMRRISHP